jgi:hypothetical protein
MKKRIRLFLAVTTFVGAATGSMAAYTVSNGTMTVLNSLNFGAIDLDGEIVYAVNCGRDWYTGTPTGATPPDVGNWGNADVAGREITIKGTTFKGDIWNYSNEARNLNSQLYFGGGSTDWTRVPTRFQGWDTAQAFRAECSGYNTGVGHPTGAAPYEGTHDFAAGIFPFGDDENKMEQILTRSAQQNTGGYNAGATDPVTGWVGCGERDMTWHFSVESGHEYKVQMLFYRPTAAGSTGQRIEIEDTLCVDMLDVDLETIDTEALLYSHTLVSQDSTLTIKVGRQTDGGGVNLAHCCAITIEDTSFATISGYVKTSGGAGISGVSISADNGGGSDTTDENGVYSFLVPDNWSGTVMPSLAGYVFSPASRTYVNVTSDSSDEDYVGSVTPPEIIRGTLTVLNSSNFEAIDLSGEILYAVNCGKDWYTGIPTGDTPPDDGNWGNADTVDRAHDIKDAYFEGDIWNYSNDARIKNGQLHFGGASTDWTRIPTRFQGWETTKTFRAECSGFNTGTGHPTGAAPYEGYHNFACNIFPDGSDENKMEQILTWSGNQNVGAFNPSATDPVTGWVGCGERDMTWSFDVEMGAVYKVQMMFYRPEAAGSTGQRIEIEDTLCVDKLNVNAVTSDTEALLYTYEIAAPDDTLTIKVGRRTDSGGNNFAHCSAITIEQIQAAGSVIRVW